MLTSYSSAEESTNHEWKLVKDKKEIQVFTRKLKDTRYREVKAVTITLDNEPDYIAETKYIRIRHSYGRYVVESLGDGTARLTWIQFVDPAGSLPAFLVNVVAVNFPYKSFLNFKKWVVRPEYQRLAFEYDKMGDIVGFKNIDNRRLNNNIQLDNNK